MSLPTCGTTTLTRFLIEEQRRSNPAGGGGFTALVNDVRLACKRISTLIGKGALNDALGAAGSHNVQGEEQQKLDLLANEIFLRTNEWGGQLAGLVSEEMAEPYPIPSHFPRGRYLLLFDPLDGSSNIDVNVAVGSIFSVLRCPDDVSEPAPADFLQPGCEQVCAGYAIYGPSTMLVLSTGQGVNGFTLDREIGEFMLTHPNLRIPEETSEFAINASNSRHWEPAIKRYVNECLAGKSGPRARDFNMRWIGSLVAESLRILVRGGVFLYPADTRAGYREGRLRLLYEAHPMALVMEWAGGAATTGRRRILELGAKTPHQRVPLIMGSVRGVRDVTAIHEGIEPMFDHSDAPLFARRGLFR